MEHPQEGRQALSLQWLTDQKNQQCQPYCTSYILCKGCHFQPVGGVVSCSERDIQNNYNQIVEEEEKAGEMVVINLKCTSRKQD